MGYCFAAAVTAEDALKAKAISWVMVGGLAGAIIGPQLVIFTRDAVAGTPYVGSFLSQALLPLIALPILLMLRTPSQTQAEAVADSGRTVLQLLAMPRYLLAVAAGVVSYGVMAFVMTAAPVAMVNHGHSVDNAALGIQWHLLAMFGPSFFTGRLMVRYGKVSVHSKTSCHPADFRPRVTSHSTTRGYFHEKTPHRRTVASPNRSAA